MDKIKKYRPDHEDIQVFCPKCGKLVQGWTYTIDWGKTWINHVVPNDKGVECWATPEEMKPIEREWERKYEYTSTG